MSDCVTHVSADPAVLFNICTSRRIRNALNNLLFYRCKLPLYANVAWQFC